MTPGASVNRAPKRYHGGMPDPAPPGPLQQPATWSATAPGYAEEVGTFSAPYAEEALRRVPLRPTDEVLDVATGPGPLAFLAARHAARVTAVDFAPGMIAELEKRKVRENVSNLTGAVMDAQSLDFPDASFDAGFCLFGFMFFPDRSRACAELRRVLRPGGRLLVATWATIDRRPAMQVGFEALAEALPDLPKPQKGDLQTHEDCAREFTEAGFTDVEVESFTSTWRVESPAHYFRIMERSGAPFVALKKKLGAEAWAEAERRFLDALTRRLALTGPELSAEAIFTSGVR